MAKRIRICAFAATDGSTVLPFHADRSADSSSHLAPQCTSASAYVKVVASQAGARYHPSVRVPLIQAVVLSLLSLGVGLTVNALSPHPVALRHPVYAAAEAATCPAGPGTSEPVVRISFDEAEKFCNACTAAFVDARSSAEYTAGHIANAIHLPPVGHPDEPAALAALTGFKTIVVYDGDASCKLAEGVARRLKSSGHADVRVLSGAWPAWVASGGPGASGACSLCHREAQP